MTLTGIRTTLWTVHERAKQAMDDPDTHRPWNVLEQIDDRLGDLWRQLGVEGLEFPPTTCGARHPRYIDVRCTQDMNRHHPSSHETTAADGLIVWAVDAVHSANPCRYAERRRRICRSITAAEGRDDGRAR